MKLCDRNERRRTVMFDTRLGHAYSESLASFMGGLKQGHLINPAAAAPYSRLTRLLADCSAIDWLPEWPFYFFLFLEAHTFLSGAIHLINFRCPFFTLRHSCKIFCQRLSKVNLLQNSFSLFMIWNPHRLMVTLKVWRFWWAKGGIEVVHKNFDNKARSPWPKTIDSAAVL